MNLKFYRKNLENRMLIAVILSHYFEFYEVVQERDALRKKENQKYASSQIWLEANRESRNLVLSEKEEETFVSLQVIKENLRK